MDLRRRTADILVFVCCSILPAVVISQDAADCPPSWQPFEDSCYRLTDSELRHDQLGDVCRQLGGSAVSIHSAEENNFVARVAAGKYIWLGMSVDERYSLVWEDGTPFSYANVLPPGNSMLKKKFAGAGVFQQNCRRWNFKSVSHLLHGVCKRPAYRCPTGSLEYDGSCYLRSSQPVPWWETGRACWETDRHAVPADLGVEDWQLNNAVTGHFGAINTLLVQVERDEFYQETCSWTTIRYGQRTTHECELGCAEPHHVLCKRPKSVDAEDAEPAAPLTMMPSAYSAGDGVTATPSAEEQCPSGWQAQGRRCVSEPFPPMPRIPAEVRCMQHGGRLAAIRHDAGRTLLALRLTGVSKAWVRDERPAAQRYPPHQQRLLGQAAAALVQPRHRVVTADGQIIPMPAELELPALCEKCQAPCGPGAVTFAGHCYLVLEEARTLKNATISCSELGTDLVSIDSVVENNFVTALAFPSSSTQCSQPTIGAWLGLRRASVANVWEWQDCSEPSEFSNWSAGAGYAGRCASLSPDGSWADWNDCQQLPQMAVCEWDACKDLGQRSYGCQQEIPVGPVY